MSEQPEAPTALDWADALEGKRGFPIPIAQAAEELRKHHSRIKELEDANADQRKWIDATGQGAMLKRINELEAALDVALEALERISATPRGDDIEMHLIARAAIAKLKEMK